MILFYFRHKVLLVPGEGFSMLGVTPTCFLLLCCDEVGGPGPGPGWGGGVGLTEWRVALIP